MTKYFFPKEIFHKVYYTSDRLFLHNRPLVSKLISDENLVMILSSIDFKEQEKYFVNDERSSNVYQ